MGKCQATVIYNLRYKMSSSRRSSFLSKQRLLSWKLSGGREGPFPSFRLLSEHAEKEVAKAESLIIYCLSEMSQREKRLLQKTAGGPKDQLAGGWTLEWIISNSLGLRPLSPANILNYVLHINITYIFSARLYQRKGRGMIELTILWALFREKKKKKEVFYHCLLGKTKKQKQTKEF